LSLDEESAAPGSKPTAALLWLGWSLASKIDVETSHLTR